MTDYSITLPITRNPLHVPRRDLVLSSADSLNLHVTVIDIDDPAGVPMVLTGGIGGPMARLIVWRHGHGGWWDYGRSDREARVTLWNGTGTLSGVKPGTFDIPLPAATMAWWPPRCGWSIHMDWGDAAGNSEMLAEGNLNVRRIPQIIPPVVEAFTDLSVPIVIPWLLSGGIQAPGGPVFEGGPTLADLEALLATLPTTQPTVPGVLWNDAGVLAVS